ncbi:Anionic cell wall polymer biosynthesis enzyme, LytR-Cps2A-Psr (LCP) family [Desulfonispora thiosulfatigenes DSM 11270]|uniref:Anionic cell wall polymer biosynthesis enzyme, LytR-Cps2A-Psr (LCP) family n=1 Tax=Desulfonispora thiosulfatigenes DSM 11270 TaxID=656914 RepID=A0A1W1V5F6_DESTI|nr:Anionic cell wall polymer biosynthesis enzyme, LytR-Cps2A-Psr (LCP) family [Desulfonispora thiosulfatigenes DSM 11270]
MFGKGRMLLMGIILGFMLFVPTVGWFSDKVKEKDFLQNVDTHRYLDMMQQDQEEKVKEIFGTIGDKLKNEPEESLITDKVVEAPNIDEAIANRAEQNRIEVVEAPKASEVKNTKKSSEKKLVKQDNHLNKKTDNTNLIVLGVDQNRLKFVSVYSINQKNKKSAGVFLPTKTGLNVNGQLLSLEKIHKKYGAESLKNLISKTMEISIPYYMEVDKQGLVDLSKIIGPVYIEDENVDVPNLFNQSPSSGDDAILQGVAKEVTKTKISDYPKLLGIFKENVKSDLGVKGAYSLYKIFKNLNHAELSKVILGGEKIKRDGQTLIIVEPYDWHNMVYQMTE